MKQTGAQAISNDSANQSQCRLLIANTALQLKCETIMSTILLIILILLLIGAVPTWPHSRDWGYGPSGGLGLVLVILLVLILLRAV